MDDQDFADSTMLAPYAQNVRIPDLQDKIFKDECFFSFDSPESEAGLYVCMEKFFGFGRKYVDKYHKKTGRRLFLHLRRVKKEIEKPKETASGENNIAEPPAEKVSRLAIGVEGGFNLDTNKFEYEDRNSVVLLPGFQEFRIDDSLPYMISLSANAIIQGESAVKKRELQEAARSWEVEQLVNSKYAENLQQLDNGVKVALGGWKCARCEKTDNLWMNLTDGAINCGRKNFDGSGGNNHAVDHYAETNYPLAVKLGTITSDGKADVFSYAKDEDNIVLDPHLKQHLAHFGINVNVMEKTEKSMVELEIDLNKKYEYSTICESGTQLVPLNGPGYTGMKNLGNTCYMNSVMQVLFTLPKFRDQYVKTAEEIFDSVNFDNIAHEENFNLQMTKLGSGLMSGDYSKSQPEGAESSNEVKCDNSVKPVSFKNLIGRGHPEFSGKQQQDAQEFYLHLLTVMERENQKNGQTDHAFNSLQFKVEDRLECGSSKQVSYSSRIEGYMALAIPVDKATNEEDFRAYALRKQEAEAKGVRLLPEDQVRRHITFAACLENFCSNEILEGYLSPVTKENTFALKRTRFRTLPDYLLIQLKKFDVDERWQPYKLDVEVDMPDEIDLGCLHKQKDGLEPGEVAIRGEDVAKQVGSSYQEPPIIPDPEIVSQMTNMGFSLERCKKAALHTKNAGLEAAMNWVFEHSGDDDLPAVEGTSTPATSIPLSDGPSKYKLVAFISHMGTSTLVGHYVCHILKEGRWVIYNDENVAVSGKTPKKHGYLYLYERIDSSASISSTLMSSHEDIQT